MKILFLIPYVPIPRVIKRIETAKKKNEVSLVFWDRGTENLEKAEKIIGVDNYRIHKKANEGNPLKRLNATLYFLIKAFRIIKKEHPGIIHVTKTDALSLVWLYKILINRKTEIIYEVSDLHSMALNNSSNLIDKLIRKVLYKAEEIFLKKVDYLIVTSLSFWEIYYRKMIAKEKVIYLPNTPDDKLFKMYSPKNNGVFTIGFIGKVRYVKQLKMLIDAASLANVRVLIAGNGKDLDEIKMYANNKSNVSIHGAYNYKEEIAKLYSEIDCIYSVYDTTIKNVSIALPNRLYESARCGIPIIAAKETYLGDLVEHKKLGLTIFDNDIQSLINVLKKLKEEGTEKYRENGLSFYQENEYESVNAKLSNVYNS